MKWTFTWTLIISCQLLLVSTKESTPTDEEVKENFLSLKGQTIPSNGTGVVIFDDIGGYLGPEEGLLCTANFSDFAAQHWSYPNGTPITTLPSVGTFGINTCHTEKGVSLYYGGKPVERGKFVCSSEIYPRQFVNSSVYIVDMEITGPHLIRPGRIVIAGEDIQLSVNVTISPEDVPVPYQWTVNGTNLPPDDNKYRGTQNETLTISNAQVQDEGVYRCSVAHSASGITKESMHLTVVDVKVSVRSSTPIPLIGRPYTLTCDLDGDDPLTNANLNPSFDYTWTINGVLLDETTDTHKSESLTFHDAGNYKCQVIIEFDRHLFGRATINYTSHEFSLAIPDVVYRIYLNNIQNCYQWTETSSIKDKLNDINTQIIHGIQKHCSQILSSGIIKNEDRGYKCPENSNPKNSVIYDAHLQGTPQANTTLLVSCLDQWIHESKIIDVNGVELGINKECTGVLNNGRSTPTECFNDKAKTDAIGLGLQLGIGFGITTGLLVVVIIIIIGILIYWMRTKHKSGYEQPNHP